MAKHKKKRNKVYTGQDAALDRPVITRISAVNRSKIGQWWFDHNKVVKIVAKIAAVVFVVVLIIFEIIKVVSGNGF